MKEKIKSIIFFFFIFSSLIILIIYAYKTIKYSAWVKVIDPNIKYIDNLENEAKSLENNACNNSIREALKYYKETSYDNNMVHISVFYNSSAWDYFINMYNDCNQFAENETEKYKPTSTFSNIYAIPYFEKIIVDKYILNYELSFFDKAARKMLDYNFEDEIQERYTLIKINEFEVLKKYINLAKEGVNNVEE